MTKKRIHELAKEYGLSGKELAAKLRARGFSQVKSHMTALDESEVLHVQAVLEVDGILPATSSDVGEESLGGVITRKKKKRIVEEPAEEPSRDEAAVETGPPVEAREPELVQPEPVARVVIPAEPAAEAPAPAPAPAPTEEPVARVAPETPAPEVESEEAPAEAAAETAPPAAAPTRPTPEPAAEPVAGPAAEAEAPEAAEPQTEEPAAEEEDAEGAESEAAAKKPKRQGKVVGFIDLSKIRTTPTRKTESRRLGSGDEDMPDVRPTLRHGDPRRAMMRGDRGARNQLSAAQLREREAGRYLRRGRGAPGAGGGRGGGGRGMRAPTGGSPYSGGTVRIEAPITVKKLAEGLAIKASELLREAFKQLGFGAVNINSPLEEDTAALLANEFDVELEIVHEVEAEEALIEELKKKRSEIEDEALAKRNPTVAFLGHVDHGKTTLIDSIRSSQVAAGEDGGITQHIGAYRVTTEAGHTLTIVDTPGHAAFTRMRARGADAVDVVVLVVAADAGVQPQTEEALNHAKAAGSPVVVALTKVDKAEANPQMAMQKLSGIGLNPELWGGDTGVIEVSGITGQGVQDLLERVFLESEILELTCHPESPAEGVVLEAEVEQGKGIVAHLLVQDGTLKRGDVILAGEGYGKVRSIHDDRGNLLEEAGPSMPVEVTGLSALPGIGEPFHVVDKLDDAKEVAEERARKNRASTLAEKRKIGAQDLLQKVTGTGGPEDVVNLIVRADVQGSSEVLRQALTDLSGEEVETRVLQSGVGAVTENDILLASTSNALVVAFRVGVNGQARQAAEREGVDIKSYQVLYDVLDDVRDLMEGRLAPDIQEEVTGHAEIRRVFKSSKFGNIAGCMVLDGTITRDNRVRLMRDDQVIHTGPLGSLRREKDDAKEVREGFECGILLRGFNDFREGDIIETYKQVEIKRKLGQT